MLASFLPKSIPTPWKLLSLLLAGALLLACGGSSGSGSMAVTRSYHTATLLPSGKVLLVGGVGSQGASLASAEIYDPATATFTTTGSLAEARNGHAATLLPNGKVLVTGGYFSSRSASRTLASAELYDPATGVFTPTAAMGMPRERPAAAMLPNGKVLLAGGAMEDGSASTSAELYDPAMGTFTSTGSMTVGRLDPTATMLSDGRVLLTGGTDLTGAEIFDPATGSFSVTGSDSTVRRNPTAILLPDGRALLAGGWQLNDDLEAFITLSNTDMYDPATGTFAITGSMSNGRSGHTATLLPNGKVLMAGGFTSIGRTLADVSPVATGELYDPVTGNSTAIFLTSKRLGHTATLLPNGKVLLSNGSGDSEFY